MTGGRLHPKYSVLSTQYGVRSDMVPSLLNRPRGKELMAGLAILETDRLLLREFDEDDVGPFYVMGSDPDIIRYVGGPGSGLTNLEQALEVLRSRPIADYQKYGYGRWACVHKATGALIGFAGLKYLEDQQEIDLGYRLLPAWWGQGLATEAGRAVVEYGRSRLHIDEIIGLVDPRNTASARVLEKLNFTFVGVVPYYGDSTAKYVNRRSIS